MYKIGDFVVHGRDVCQIVEIKEKYFNDQDYYILVPVNDKSLKISIPKNQNIRKIIDKNEVKKIIEKIPSVSIIETDSRNIDVEYKSLLYSGNHEDLIKIIKTTYHRNKERIDQHKKPSETDVNYFELAEKYLYTEFSIALNLTYEETKKYVIDEVMKNV